MSFIDVQGILENCQKMLSKPIAKIDFLVMIGSAAYAGLLEKRMRRLKNENKEIPKNSYGIWMVWLSPMVMFVCAYFFNRSPMKVSFCLFGGMTQLGYAMQITGKYF